MYNIKEHKDFKKYYDSNLNCNYWILGYFGGGSINVVDAYELAKQFSESTGVDINSVQIDEIYSSRRFKGFRFLFSTEDNQKPEEDSEICINIWKWLTD